jgi:hypothetical protein
MRVRSGGERGQGKGDASSFPRRTRNLPGKLFHNYVMAIRTTIDIPKPLHDQLRERARSSGVSIRSLIIEAIEQVYSGKRKGKMVTGPMIHGGTRGPQYPTDENPHELVFP